MIIDYNGMLKSLRKALSSFAQGDRGGTGKGEGEGDTVREDSEALAEYAASLAQTRSTLAAAGVELAPLMAAKGFGLQQLILAAVDKVCAPDERRKTFEVMVEDVQARHRALFPHPGLFEHADEDSAIGAVYNKLQEARNTPDISGLLQSLYDVVDTALTTEGNPPAFGVRQSHGLYNLSKIDFSRLRAEFEKTPYKAVALLNLQQKIEERLAGMLAQNPTRVDLYERYQQIVQAYNRDKDAAEIQKVMDDLFAVNDTLDVEQKRYLREGPGQRRTAGRV